jgi:DNA-binding LytR/AlgR family response regulator
MKIKIKSPHKEHRKLLCEASKNIVCLEANINYTTFKLQTGKTQTMSYNLAMYDTLLPATFIRVNRSCIINKSFIESLNSENKKIILKDGTEFQISRRRWIEVSENVA